MRVRNFTLKDFKEFYEEAKQILRHIGHPEIDEVKHTLSLNLNSTRTYGRCYKTSLKATEATIYLNKIYADSAPLQKIKNTVMHELIHSLPNCSGHTGKWKSVAQHINLAFPEKYNITRLAPVCAEFSDTILKEQGKKVKQVSTYKYAVVCNNCSAEFKYKKEGKVVKDVKAGKGNLYRCPDCHQKGFTVKEVMH